MNTDKGTMVFELFADKTPKTVNNVEVYRVRVGPYAERNRAETRAVELSELGLAAVVTEEPQR